MSLENLRILASSHPRIFSPGISPGLLRPLHRVPLDREVIHVTIREKLWRLHYSRFLLSSVRVFHHLLDAVWLWSYSGDASLSAPWDAQLLLGCFFFSLWLHELRGKGELLPSADCLVMLAGRLQSAYLAPAFSFGQVSRHPLWLCEYPLKLISFNLSCNLCIIYEVFNTLRPRQYRATLRPVNILNRARIHKGSIHSHEKTVVFDLWHASSLLRCWSILLVSCGFGLLSKRW